MPIPPPKITSRTGLIGLFTEKAIDPACKRALQGGGTVTLWGGFDRLPPTGLAGWVAHVRSEHGREWILALVADDVGHRYLCNKITAIPWQYWAGHYNEDFWKPKNGDKPYEAFRKRIRACQVIHDIQRWNNGRKTDSAS